MRRGGVSGRKKSFNSTWHFISFFTSIFSFFHSSRTKIRQRANSITNSDAPLPGAHQSNFFSTLFRFPPLFSLWCAQSKIAAWKTSLNKLHCVHIWFDYNLCGISAKVFGREITAEALASLMKTNKNFSGVGPRKSIISLPFRYVNWVIFPHTQFLASSSRFAASRGARCSIDFFAPLQLYVINTLIISLSPVRLAFLSF